MMAAWLLRLWHWFALGSTTKSVGRIGYPGSIAALACALEAGARATMPCNIVYDIRVRRAADLERGTVRIVIETRDA